MTKVQEYSIDARGKTYHIWAGFGPILTSRPRIADEGTVRTRSIPQAQLMPWGYLLPITIQRQVQVLKESSKGIGFLGILGRSGIAWKFMQK